MHIGIFASTFRRPNLGDLLDAVRGYGFSHIQFDMTCVGLRDMPESIDDALCDQIRDEMERRNLTMVTLSGTFNMSHPDPEPRRDGIRRLRVLASCCQRMGTSIITLCTGTRDRNSMWRPHPENNSQEAWNDLTATMQDALQIAEDCQVTLVLEPEVSNVVDSAKKARRLLDEMRSPHLKVIMDGANIFHQGELPRMREILDEAFQLLGDDIVSAHAKDLDHDGEAGHLPAGHGELDYVHYLSLLRDVGFEGTLLLHGLRETDVPGCRDFLQRKWRTSLT